jgi:hypothetical protein
MNVVGCPEKSDLMSFNDKVMGVFERLEEFDRFAASVAPDGQAEIEVLYGPSGRTCLEQVKWSVEGFLDSMLGDMESAMMKVYLQAVDRGAVVFAAPATSENRDLIVDTAVRQGGKNIAHFGQLITESFEHLAGDPPP